MSDRTLLTVTQRTSDGEDQTVTGMWAGLATSSWLPLLAMVLEMDHALEVKYGAVLPNRRWACQVLPSPGEGFPLASWEQPSP